MKGFSRNNHALLMGTFTGQSFISPNVDRRIWFTGFVQKPMEVSVLDQTGIVDLVRGGIKHRITRPEILSRDALKEVERSAVLRGLTTLETTLRICRKERL